MRQGISLSKRKRPRTSLRNTSDGLPHEKQLYKIRRGWRDCSHSNVEIIDDPRAALLVYILIATLMHSLSRQSVDFKH